jgi:hypothetical protein
LAGCRCLWTDTLFFLLLLLLLLLLVLLLLLLVLCCRCLWCQASQLSGE